MLKKDENALSMIYSLNQAVTQYDTIWTGYRPFATSIGLFRDKIPLIEQYRDKQVSDIRGYALDKEAIRNEVTNTAFQVSGKLASYARSVKNNTLLKAVDFTHSELNAKRDTTLTGVCNNLIKLASDHLADLTDYGITQPVIDQFRTASQDYHALVSAPRVAISDRKTAGGMLTRHIREAVLILKERVDVDAEHFRTANPEFYALYKNVRIIPDYGVRKKGQSVTTISGDCADFETHNALAGVTVKIMGQNIEMTTGADGKFSLKVANPGEVILRAEKEGYTPWEDELMMEAGDVLTLLIEMEKIEEP